MIEPRLSLVTLGVADLARATAFYEALGWPRRFRAADGVAFFQIGGLGLSLFPDADLAADAGVAPPANDGFRGITLSHNVSSREAVDETIATMIAAGATSVRPGEAKEWGGYGGYVADPDGHLWEIAWNPFFPLTETGGMEIPG